MLYARRPLHLLIYLFCLLTLLPVAAQKHWMADAIEHVNAQRGDDATPLKCGMPVLAEAYAMENGREIYSQIHQQRLAKSAAAQVTYLSPSGHFLISYDTTGLDAVPDYDRNNDGFPDFVDFVAESFDHAWEIEIDSLGFRPPPDQSGQPVSVYPVLCERLSNGFYGLTFFDVSSDITDLPGFNYTSEISITTDFSFREYPHISNDPILRDSAAIAVTAAHEFNHAIQLGYRIWFEDDNPNRRLIDLRYLESSATYMEEVLHDEVNDYYQCLPSYYRRTDRHFGDSNVLYGDAIFFMMLDDFYGETITREIWDQVLSEPSLEAMNTVFLEKNSDLNAELQRLATWMYFSGDNTISGQFFEEAAEYPNPDVIETTPVTVTESETVVARSSNLPSLAFKHIRVPVSSSGGVSAAVNPSQSANTWFGTDLFFSPPFSTEFPAAVFTQVQFAPPSSDVTVAVLSGNWDYTGQQSPINYDVAIRGTTSVSTPEVQAYPNVIKPGREASQVTFINLPPDALVEIFSGNGLRLASIPPEGSGQIAFWDLTTSQGDPVVSGVYIYRVTSEQDTQTGKIMIIR